MTPNAPSPLDDILDRFVLENDTPTPQALAALLERYPYFRAAIVAFATAWSEQTVLPAREEPDSAREGLRIEDTCAKFEATTATRDALRSTAPGSGDVAVRVPSSLFELSQRVGLGLVELAAGLGLDVGLVAKMDRRAVRVETLPRKLLDAMSRTLDASAGTILGVLAGPPAQAMPAFMIVRSTGSPLPESFADAVKASTLSEQAKEQWLTEVI